MHVRRILSSLALLFALCVPASAGTITITYTFFSALEDGYELPGWSSPDGPELRGTLTLALPTSDSATGEYTVPFARLIATFGHVKFHAYGPANISFRDEGSGPGARDEWRLTFRAVDETLGFGNVYPNLAVRGLGVENFLEPSADQVEFSAPGIRGGGDLVIGVTRVPEPPVTTMLMATLFGGLLFVRRGRRGSPPRDWC